MRLVGGIARHESVDHLDGRTGSDRQGEYLRWSFDAGQGCVIIETSPYGMFPCYVHESANQLIASPSIVPIADRLESLTFDANALSLLVRSFSTIGNLTPFKEVRALLPGSTVRWSGGAPSVETPSRRRLPRAISRTVAIDEFIERFRVAMSRRRMSGPFVLPLTGGRDSRHILFELLRAGNEPAVCLTRGSGRDESGDGAVAAELCQAFGLRHDLRAIVRRTSEITHEKNVATSFVIPGQHIAVTEVARDLLQYGRPVYDGIGGDVMMQGNWLTAKRWTMWERGHLDRLADDLLAPEAKVRALLRPETRQRWSRERAVAVLREELERYNEEPNPLSSFAFCNYTRRAVASYTFGMLAPRIPVACPYLDPDVHEFLASLSPELFLDGEFHTECIARAFPDWAHMRYEAKEGRPRSKGDIRHFAAVAISRALARGRGVMSAAGVLRLGLPRLLKGDFRLTTMFFLAQLMCLAHRDTRSTIRISVGSL